ncbi:MAG: V-type ATP synthase subunit D [Clostridia bacterium]|nr:V-type ATP synthase subunit D [Clostridia bacterium]
MARLNVNPTRMELKKVKTRYQTATKGHKLLKDKTDELIRKFTVILRQNKRLREEVETDVENLFRDFAKAKTLMGANQLLLAFSQKNKISELDFKVNSEFNIEVPNIEYNKQELETQKPYSFIDTTFELDYSIEKVKQLMPRLIELAQTEKTMKLLSQEISKLKRRVSALENLIIPQCEETIKYIEMKLDENERGNVTRLMKVKDIIKK